MKLVIDPGHGGRDSGATGNGLQEKYITLQIAKRIRDILSSSYNINVKMTRETDVYVSLSKRAAIANAFGADYFISIHVNGGGGTGYEDYIYSNVSDASATAQKRRSVHEAVVPVLQSYNLRDRGMKKANFAVLRETAMDAVLVEILFIDTESDANLLKNAQFIEDISQAYAQGIVKAMGAVPLIRYIVTGGLNESMVLEAGRFLQSRGWYGRIIYPGGNDTPFLETGGLTPSMLDDAEKWLKERGWYYEVKPR